MNMECAHILRLRWHILFSIGLHGEEVYPLIKYSRATSHAKWLSDERTNVSRTISVLIIRALMCQIQYHR
jgi:hypothetical protein